MDSFSPPTMALLRCKFLGHLWKFNGAEDPSDYTGGAYRVHVACKRCWKVKVLVKPATSITAKRTQE